MGIGGASAKATTTWLDGGVRDRYLPCLTPPHSSHYSYPEDICRVSNLYLPGRIWLPGRKVTRLKNATRPSPTGRLILCLPGRPLPGSLTAYPAICCFIFVLCNLFNYQGCETPYPSENRTTPYPAAEILLLTSVSLVLADIA